jgi:hypothetical protein
MTKRRDEMGHKVKSQNLIHANNSVLVFITLYLSPMYDCIRFNVF